MKLKVKTSELSKAVANVGKVISLKSIDLILNNVLLQVDDKVSLITTNLEQVMKHDLIGEIIEPGGITETVLPYDLLKDITPKFKGEFIELDILNKKVEIMEIAVSLLFIHSIPKHLRRFLKLTLLFTFQFKQIF